MPRRLLRNGQVVTDDWKYLAETADDGGNGEDKAVILPLDRWLTERDVWSTRALRLGVVLAPADKVEDLVPDIGKLALIAAQFGTANEGRGYTQARLLRERWKFTGEVRAIGFVRRDHVFFMARCGFDSFELPDAEIDESGTALSTFSAAYQTTNDIGLAVTLRHRS
jgi:uncharacterized protein (DUF934 family)